MHGFSIEVDGLDGQHSLPVERGNVLVGAGPLQPLAFCHTIECHGSVLTVYFKQSG
jgi:hypothetical protein